MNIANISYIRRQDPKMAEALLSIGQALENVATQTNSTTQSKPPLPSAPPSLTIGASGGLVSASVGAPPPAGHQYHLEYSPHPNFSTYTAVPLGAGNSRWSGSVGSGKLYWRARTVSLAAAATSSQGTYFGSEVSPTGVAAGGSSSTVASTVPTVGVSTGGGFIPSPYTAPDIAGNVTGLTVTATAVPICGQPFTKLHVSCNAPSAVTGNDYTFQGIILALVGLQGSSYPQAVASQEFTGSPAGAIELDVFVPSSTDTVTVYAVSYNIAALTVADWTSSANVVGVSLNPGLSIPTAPSSIVGTALSKCALITWGGITTPGLVGYRVYRSTTNTFTTAAAIGISPGIEGTDANGNTPLGQFRDDTAATGTPYFYWLTSVLAGPVESLPTTSVTVTPL